MRVCPYQEDAKIVQETIDGSRGAIFESSGSCGTYSNSMLRAAVRCITMSSGPLSSPLIAVVGATGIGKSQVSPSRPATLSSMLLSRFSACGIFSSTIQWRDHQR